MRKNFVGKLSVTEFVNLANEYDGFTYNSRDQRHAQTGIAAQLEFNKMNYMLCPNMICLSNESGSISFSPVKYINRYEIENATWSMFSIVCTDPDNIRGVVEHCIVGNKKLKQFKKLC